MLLELEGIRRYKIKMVMMVAMMRNFDVDVQVMIEINSRFLLSLQLFKLLEKIEKNIIGLYKRLRKL